MRWYEEHHGCECVRAAASKGTWDIIAWNDKTVYYIQNKSNVWPGGEEMERIQAAKIPPYAHKHIVRWDDRAREPRFRYV